MPITEEQFRRLKREVEDAKSESDQAQGALKQLMKRLVDEFGCSSAAAAKDELAKLERKEKKAREEFETAVAAYEEKWKRE